MSFRPRFMAERFHPLALAIPCLLLLTSGCDDPSANTPKTSNRPKGVVYQVGADNFIPLVLYSERTSLVEFWGPNCEPCIEIEPVIREIAKQNRDIMVAKYNVQIEAGVADRYGVGVIPTFIVFKEGEVQAKLVGYQSKQRLLDAIEGKITGEYGPSPRSDLPNQGSQVQDHAGHDHAGHNHAEPNDKQPAEEPKEDESSAGEPEADKSP